MFFVFFLPRIFFVFGIRFIKRYRLWGVGVELFSMGEWIKLGETGEFGEVGESGKEGEFGKEDDEDELLSDNESGCERKIGR